MTTPPTYTPLNLGTLDSSAYSGITIDSLNFDMSKWDLSKLDIKVDIDAMGLAGTNYDKKVAIITKSVAEKYAFPNNCISLDEILGTLTKDIAKYSLNPHQDELYLLTMKERLAQGKAFSETKDCRNLMEQKRLNEAALLSTKYAIQEEKSVVSKGFQEQQIYIAIGSVVMLTALFLILKK